LYLPSTLFFIGVADVARFVYQRLEVKGRLALQVALALQLFVSAYQLTSFTLDLHDEDTLFRSIIAAAPDRSHGYGYYGLTFLEQNRFPEAAVLLAKAVELAPDHLVFTAKYGQALLFARQTELALEVARKARARLGEHPTLYLVEAYAQLESNPEQAKRELQACLRMSPGHAECKAALEYLAKPSAR
jgi:predicted Zn-dependent protease